eukprot:TRINITY_DN3148_c0_g1_i3.p1 TRINITY_DN3148_c0_g1~~TRINITY_DN3148_c0_g1_i3.p1  ORF type:complete len:381 (-),score=50.63 TRINITY_DN3148_c0_g1_i3:23-1165(-)
MLIFLVIEDDLLVAPDFIDFFKQVLPSMLVNPDVWCVSAWSDHGWPASVQDPTKVLREQHLGGLGWAFNRRDWINYVKSHEFWISQSPWDGQLSYVMTESGSNKYCLYPQISRTYHAALDTTDGNSQSSATQDDILANVLLSDSRDTLFLIQEGRVYEKQLQKELISAKIITCRDDILSFSKQKLLMFIDASDDNHETWQAVGSVFANLGYLVRPHRPMRTIYKGVVSMTWSDNQIFFLGSYSPLISGELASKLNSVTPLSTEQIQKTSCQSDQTDDKLWTHPYDNLFTAITSSPGESCSSACKKEGLQCDVHYFVNLNQEIVVKGKKPDTICDRSLPRHAWNMYPWKASGAGSWQGNMCTRWYNCHQSAQGLQRLCPCV